MKTPFISLISHGAVEMMMKSNAGKYNPKTEAISKLFNEYFGSGFPHRISGNT